MRIDPFALERFQSLYENTVEYNLTETGVHPLTIEELFQPRGASGPSPGPPRLRPDPTAIRSCAAASRRCTPERTKTA